MIEEELDLMNILKQLKKLQAVVDTLAEDHTISLSNIQKKFVNSITIYTDSEDEDKYEKSKNKLQQFMELNENDLLNDLNDEQSKKKLKLDKKSVSLT